MPRVENMNDLTRKLFEKGYTKDRHPDHVRWIDYMHEFEYTPEHVSKMVLESPCGLLMKGIDFHGYMSFMGIDWRLENNNSVHRCPFGKVNCKLNHKYLQKPFGHGYDIVQCAFKQSGKEYDYEKSYEKIRNDKSAIIEAKRKEFYNKLKWNKNEKHCACIKWDDKKQEWQAKYNPVSCVNDCYINGCYVNDICVLTGKKLNGKKGNVFYDLKVTRICKDNSFWHGEEVVRIIKGKKAFDRTKPLIICEAYARMCKEEILGGELSNYCTELFFDKDMKIEVLNVRVEYRETRDLMQDLQDAREGIKVFHASDLKKAKEREKREKREKNNTPERKYKKMVRKWGLDKIKEVIELAHDYEPEEISQMMHLGDKYYINKYYINKILKIEGIESLVEKDLHQNKQKVEQLSILDLEV